MKKEDKKYYALPDGSLREIPAGLEIPEKSGWGTAYLLSLQIFDDRLKQQPAIYTDEKFPVGVVEGEIGVEYQIIITVNGQDVWQKVGKECYDNYPTLDRRLFATRKREEVNTENLLQLLTNRKVYGLTDETAKLLYEDINKFFTVTPKN